MSWGHVFTEAARDGAYLYDDAGHRYLDATTSGGVYNLGRHPPELAEALQEAAGQTDQGNFPMISEEKAALAEALAGFVPGGLACTVFAVMRGEAMDAACKIARGYTHRPGLVTVDGGGYGQTGFALALADRNDRACYEPLIPDVSAVPFGDVGAVAQAIDRRTAAFVIEPVQAENGCRVADAAYLREVARLCRRRGALLVVDETQSGFGRTGIRFAFEDAGIAPDILVLGEALGGGMFPIAATMLTRRVKRFLNRHPMIHLSTFGGSDIGCRVASRALECYTREAPWKNAAARGQELREGLEGLRAKHPAVIRGVEGRGLLLAIDLGARQVAEMFCRHARDAGLFVVPGEVARHTIVLRPSLLISRDEVGEILGAVTSALQALGQ